MLLSGLRINFLRYTGEFGRARDVRVGAFFEHHEDGCPLAGRRGVTLYFVQ
jgi:hypothetical protein